MPADTSNGAETRSSLNGARSVQIREYSSAEIKIETENIRKIQHPIRNIEQNPQSNIAVNRPSLPDVRSENRMFRSGLVGELTLFPEITEAGIILIYIGHCIGESQRLCLLAGIDELRNGLRALLITRLQARLAREIQLPPGMTIEWSGQYENQLRAQRTLRLIVPAALFIIFLLLYIVYHSFKEAAHVILAVPFALTGGVFLQYLLGYNFSVAVWVGYIALFGTAIQTGIVPPTINLVEPDPPYDLDFVQCSSRRLTLHHAMSNSFAFGGFSPFSIVAAIHFPNDP